MVNLGEHTTVELLTSTLDRTNHTQLVLNRNFASLPHSLFLGAILSTFSSKPFKRRLAGGSGGLSEGITTGLGPQDSLSTIHRHPHFYRWEKNPCWKTPKTFSFLFVSSSPFALFLLNLFATFAPPFLHPKEQPKPNCCFLVSPNPLPVELACRCWGTTVLIACQRAFCGFLA